MYYINLISKVKEKCPSCNGDGCKKCGGMGYKIVRREEEVPLDTAIEWTNVYNRGRFDGE